MINKKVNIFATTTIYRGKATVIEVAEASAITKVPDTGTWRSGSLNTVSRYFDISCSGSCKLGSINQKLKLDFCSSDKIPDFFTKNNEGKIVFAESKAMTTITSPKGHDVWLKIDLVKINGQFSNAEKHVCLGIKKRSEDEYYDILHMSNKSRYVDAMDGDPVELVPLLSSTDISSKLTLATPTEEVVPANFGISGDSFDFGSVYRVNIEVQGGQWITETCKLTDISAEWSDMQSVNVGTVNGKDNRLLAVSSSGTLIHSANGVNWINLPTKLPPIDTTRIAYGNGIWCIINGVVNDNSDFHNPVDYRVRYSTDGGVTWISHSSISDIPQYGTRAFAFDNGIFMMGDTNGKIHTSRDAILWRNLEQSATQRTIGCFLTYGNHTWIVGNGDGQSTAHKSKDGVNWTPITLNLLSISSARWTGACFANGYFYAISTDGVVAKSLDGEKWEEVIRFEEGASNIIYYKNKLHVFSEDTCHIGFLES